MKSLTIKEIEKRIAYITLQLKRDVGMDYQHKANYRQERTQLQHELSRRDEVRE